MDGQFSRQSFLGPHSEETLANVRAGIVGLGGGGSHIAQQLAHIGVGHFALFDPDVMEFPNLNRTVGATHEDAIKGTPKVRVSERLIRGVNPYAEVWPFQSPWQLELTAVRSCDVVFGCLDGFTRRAELEKSCRRALIPLIDIGMDVYEGNQYSIAGQVITSMPGEPCFRCVQFIKQEDLEREGARYGEAGANPQVIWPNGTLASSAVGVFVLLFSPWCEINPAVSFLGYDGNNQTLEHDVRYKRFAGSCKHFEPIGDLGDPLWKP